MYGLDDNRNHELPHVIGVLGESTAAQGASHQQTCPQSKVAMPRGEMLFAPAIFVAENAEECDQYDGGGGRLQFPMQSHTIDMRQVSG